MTDINTETIPAALKDRDQWLLWDSSHDAPRRPCGWDPHSLRPDWKVSWNDPNDWMGFKEALEASQNMESLGIGYVMTEGGPITGLDLDGCVSERGKPEGWLPSLEPFAEETYLEYSPSGNGIHALLSDVHLPDWWTDSHVSDEEHEGVEAYQSKFFTVTGDVLEISAAEPASVDPREWLLEAYEEINGELPRYESSDSTPRDGPDVDVYDVLSSGSFPAGERQEHPFHSSGTGSNFHVDEGGETWRCWRHSCTGNAMHLIGIEQGVIECGEWDSGGLSSDTWADIFDAAREAGYDLPEKETSADGGNAAQTSNTTNTPGPDASQTEIKLDQAAVKARAGLGEDSTIDDLDDREKAACVWTLIRESDAYHVRVRRDNGSLWAYDCGVWKPEGERALRYAARECLGNMQTGSNVIKQLKVQARSDPSAEVEADYFGLEPGKIAVENGLLNLEAAADGVGRDAIRPLEPGDYALSRLPVEYDPDADAEEWQEFVGDVVETEKIRAVQEYVGYALHRSAMPFAKALLLVGSGSNGKSTFLNTIRTLLGEEHTTTKAVHKFDEENHVADLYGSLANIDSDLSEGSLSSKGIAQFKRLVGGDTVDGRKLYEDAFSFKPSAKHLYACNQVPDVSNYVTDNDIAFWRRWIVVEFPKYIRPSERDPDLEDRLASDASLSGILNWAIEGWGRLMDQDGFSGVESHDQTRRKWQSWGESVDKFVAECVDRDESAARMTTREAYRRYEAWCRQNNEDSVGQQRLTNTLKEENVGYGRHRIDGESQRGYKALSFSEDVPHVSDETDDEDGDDLGDGQSTLR